MMDWKTNCLRGRMTDFSADGMSQEVDANMYRLQYLIYTVALWHFLGERLGLKLDKTNYERRFGGVFYLFVRGMAAPLPEPEMTAGQKDVCRRRGIFYDRPEFGLIEDFKKLLDIRSQTH